VTTRHTVRRILLFGEEQERADRVTRILENDGYIVTTTLSSITALDLAGNSAYDGLVIDDKVPLGDRRYLLRMVQIKEPFTAAVILESPASVVGQLKQAFKEVESSRPD
jgi:DNA-binding response OmpR family regulator